MSNIEGKFVHKVLLARFIDTRTFLPRPFFLRVQEINKMKRREPRCV